MAPQKEIIMVMKVDLDCPSCYKKVKKLICSFPQIKEQSYNEKQNIVMMKVVCCSPDKIKDKLRCKGGKSIKDIQIYNPPRPDPPPKGPPKKPTDNEPETRRGPPMPTVQEEPTIPPSPPPKHRPAFPRDTCCLDCYEGRTTGPCYNGYGYRYGCGYGVPPPPPPPEGGWGCNYYGGCPPCGYRACYSCISPCHAYVIHDNPPACAIM